MIPITEWLTYHNLFFCLMLTLCQEENTSIVKHKRIMCTGDHPTAPTNRGETSPQGQDPHSHHQSQRSESNCEQQRFKYFIPPTATSACWEPFLKKNLAINQIVKVCTHLWKCTYLDYRLVHCFQVFIRISSWIWKKTWKGEVHQVKVQFTW